MTGRTRSGRSARFARPRPRLGTRFLILYGDTYLRIDYAAVARAWERSGLPALMTVLRNEGRWDISNVVFDGERVRRTTSARPQRTCAGSTTGSAG